MLIRNDIILTIEEKDFESGVSLRGKSVDIINVPMELVDKWKGSELERELKPCLKTTGQVFYTYGLDLKN